MDVRDGQYLRFLRVRHGVFSICVICVPHLPRVSYIGAAKLFERKRLCPHPGSRVKRFFVYVSPYLTLSFSALINIDGRPDSSGGQNP